MMEACANVGDVLAMIGVYAVLAALAGVVLWQALRQFVKVLAILYIRFVWGDLSNAGSIVPPP